MNVIITEKKNTLVKYANEQIVAKKQHRNIPTVNKKCYDQPRSKI